MNKPLVGSTSLDLTVKFIGGPPIDDVVYWIRRCAERSQMTGALTVVLERKPATGSAGSSNAYEVRLERPDRVLVSERDPNLMLAVRTAFDRLPLAAIADAHVSAGASRRTSPVR
jgi:hypothetical protein